MRSVRLTLVPVSPSVYLPGQAHSQSAGGRRGAAVGCGAEGFQYRRYSERLRPTEAIWLLTVHSAPFTRNTIASSYLSRHVFKPQTAAHAAPREGDSKPHAAGCTKDIGAHVGQRCALRHDFPLLDLMVASTCVHLCAGYVRNRGRPACPVRGLLGTSGTGPVSAGRVVKPCLSWCLVAR